MMESQEKIEGISWEPSTWGASITILQAGLGLFLKRDDRLKKFTLGRLSTVAYDPFMLLAFLHIMVTYSHTIVRTGQDMPCLHTTKCSDVMSMWEPRASCNGEATILYQWEAS